MITGTYNLPAFLPSQNPLQEVYLECDTTTAPVTINLFQIAEVSRQWDCVIYVSDATNSASGNPITINCGAGDHFDSSGTTSITIGVDGGGISLRIVSETAWLATNGAGGSGGTITDVTYSQLYDKIVNATLQTGAKYRVTDYRSVNFLNGWQLANQNPIPTLPSFDPREIYVGDNEPLIVTALSSYQLEPIAYSEVYGADIIEYQGYTNKIGVSFDIFNGSTLPDSTIVSGFDLQWDGTNVYFNMPANYPALFGHYFYLYCEFDGGTYYQDGTFDPLSPVVSTCQYPYTNSTNYLKPMSRLSVSPDGLKVILLDLTEQDYLNYDAGTLYVDTIYAIGDAYGQITRRNDTERSINVPFDFRSRKYRRYEVDLSGDTYLSNFNTGFYAIGDNPFIGGVYVAPTGAFRDFYCFGNDGNDVFGVQMSGVGGIDGWNYYAGWCDNFVVISGLRYFNSNQPIIDSTFGDVDNLNFDSRVRNGLFGSAYNSSMTSSIIESTAVVSFLNSKIISGNLFTNKIGTVNNTTINSGTFGQNTLNGLFNVFINAADTFQGNNFTNAIVNCDFNLRQFVFCIFTPAGFSTFIDNVINYDVSSVNFSSATHVTISYNCEIFRRSDNTLQLSYVDGTNTIQYTAINA